VFLTLNPSIQPDPLSLHKYLYANASPIDMGDPSGFTAISTTEAIKVSELIGTLSSAFSSLLYVGSAVAIGFYLGPLPVFHTLYDVVIVW
jgi:hypothetical protein